MYIRTGPSRFQAYPSSQEFLIKGSLALTSKTMESPHLLPQSLQELLTRPKKQNGGRKGNAGEEGGSFLLSVLTIQ